MYFTARTKENQLVEGHIAYDSFIVTRIGNREDLRLELKDNTFDFFYKPSSLKLTLDNSYVIVMSKHKGRSWSFYIDDEKGTDIHDCQNMDLEGDMKSVMAFIKEYSKQFEGDL